MHFSASSRRRAATLSDKISSISQASSSHTRSRGVVAEFLTLFTAACQPIFATGVWSVPRAKEDSTYPILPNHSPSRWGSSDASSPMVRTPYQFSFRLRRQAHV